ncbi:MAG: hypothetical protein ACKOC5_07745, partial [Chloroflexota bacterium]
MTLAALVLMLATSIALTLVSNRLHSLDGWWSIVAVGALSLGILALGWRLLAEERPPLWLGKLLLLAAALHLFAGMLWMGLLPRYGHGNQAERQGYVMGDAYARDNVAWRLARSNEPLISAFTDNRRVDQYGGLLFLSAAVYRYLGADFHQPMLVLM